MTNSVTTTLSPSGLRGFPCHKTHVHGTRSIPIPDSLRMLDTRPLDQRLMMVSGIRISWFCNVRVSCPWNPRYADSRYAKFWFSGIFHHESSLMDDIDPVGKSRIAISCWKHSKSLETPICRTPTLQDPLPCVSVVWMAQILSYWSLVRISYWYDTINATVRISYWLSRFCSILSTPTITYESIILTRRYH